MKYISILRGINVSGQKLIKMADLSSLYELLGFKNIITYIQSGNIIFDTTIENVDALKITIEKAIEKKYYFHVPVQIRSDIEIGNIIDNCPFGPVNPVEDGTKVLVSFLSSEPSETSISDVQNHVVEPEKLVVRGKEVYLYCPNGYGKSKLSNTFLERKLKVSATTRNWNTVHKLHELSAN